MKRTWAPRKTCAGGGRMKRIWDLTYETRSYDGIKVKTGTLSGTMICSEKQYNSLPYRGNINGRIVLITVMGRQTVFDAVTWATRGQPVLIDKPESITLQLQEESRREMNGQGLAVVQCNLQLSTAPTKPQHSFPETEE